MAQVGDGTAMVHSGSHISLKQSPSKVDLSRDKHQEGSQGLGAFLHQEASVSEGGESESENKKPALGPSENPRS